MEQSDGVQRQSGTGGKEKAGEAARVQGADVAVADQFLLIAIDHLAKARRRVQSVVLAATPDPVTDPWLVILVEDFLRQAVRGGVIDVVGLGNWMARKRESSAKPYTAQEFIADCQLAHAEDAERKRVDLTK